MIVSLIAALAEDRVIGSVGGGIPWEHPRDRAHFRARTAGRWLLLGRRTYEEMRGWFGERTPIVLSRNGRLALQHPSHRLASTVPEAISLARAGGTGELLVCGGASVYAESLPFADRLLLTRLDLRIDVTEPVRFPDFEAVRDWQLVHLERWPRTENAVAARFEIYRRRPHSPLADAGLRG